MTRTYSNLLILLTMLLLSAMPALALDVGDPAPDFTLMDTEGVEHSLSDHQGKVVFLFFMGGT